MHALLICFLACFFCSGVFMKPEIAKLSSELLLKYDKTPPDIVIQQCLRGELDECSQCAQTLVTSKTLLMYHIGYNTSTSEDRLYKKDEFQCGWRHPFVSLACSFLCFLGINAKFSPIEWRPQRHHALKKTRDILHPFPYIYFIIAFTHLTHTIYIHSLHVPSLPLLTRASFRYRTF